MMSEPMSEEDNEDRDRMISQAMSLLLASSRVNHILHDAVMEVDKEMSRLRSENERLREAGQRAWDFAVFVHFHEEAAKHGDECDLPLEASILADLMARTLQPEMFE